MATPSEFGNDHVSPKVSDDFALDQIGIASFWWTSGIATRGRNDNREMNARC
jgi:hypothetical protein